MDSNFYKYTVIEGSCWLSKKQKFKFFGLRYKDNVLYIKQKSFNWVVFLLVLLLFPVALLVVFFVPSFDYKIILIGAAIGLQVGVAVVIASTSPFEKLLIVDQIKSCKIVLKPCKEKELYCYEIITMSDTYYLRVDIFEKWAPIFGVDIEEAKAIDEKIKSLHKNN